MTETPIAEIDAARYATRRARRAAERAQETAAFAATPDGPSPIGAELAVVDVPASTEVGTVPAEVESALVVAEALEPLDAVEVMPLVEESLVPHVEAESPVLSPVEPDAPAAPAAIDLGELEAETAATPVVAAPRARRVAATSVRAPRSRPAAARPRHRRRAARVLSSGVAMLCAAGLAVALALPGNGLGTTSAADASTASTGTVAATPTSGGQSLALADSAAAAAGTTASRDAFSAMSRADVIRAQYAGQLYRPTFVPTAGAIRWPFAYSVAVSAPYGYSSSYAFGWHDGVDFVPGYGAPVSAIADGVVIWVGWDGALGYCVRIQHQIDGHTVVSIYGHMIDGSSDLYPSEQISVATVVGLTGQTGEATGPHLHLGLTIDGAYTDPYVWLTENATNVK